MSGLVDSLVDDAMVVENKGCYTCWHYDSNCENDLEFVDGDEDEVYWVWCRLNPEMDTLLKINCGDWEER